MACALSAVVLSIAGGAHADPAPERTRVHAALSDMQAGRLLIRAGRWEDAYAFLEQAEPADEDGRIERLFLLGRIELRLGRPAKAAERFESILAIRPGLARVRLEVARAYYLAGRDDKARHHFRASLAHELPTTVEAAVADFLRRIDARKRWSVSVSASMLPATKRPQREFILIGGVPFRLDEEARSGSGTGVLLSGGASLSRPIARGLQGVLATSAAAKGYERSSWNEMTAAGEAGVARLAQWGSASGGVRLTRLWTGGDPQRRSLGPWARTGFRVSDSTRLDIALDAAYRWHDADPRRNGWRLSVVPRLTHTFDGRTSIEVEPTVEAVSAHERHSGNRLVGLAATLSRVLEGGCSVSLSVSTQTRRYDGPDPLFATRRTDKTRRVAFRVRHRSWRYRGLAPYVGYSVERTRSTIPVHEHYVQGLIAGVSFGHRQPTGE